MIETVIAPVSKKARRSHVEPPELPVRAGPRRHPRAVPRSPCPGRAAPRRGTARGVGTSTPPRQARGVGARDDMSGKLVRRRRGRDRDEPVQGSRSLGRHQRAPVDEKIVVSDDASTSRVDEVGRTILRLLPGQHHRQAHQGHHQRYRLCRAGPVDPNPAVPRWTAFLQPLAVHLGGSRSTDQRSWPSGSDHVHLISLGIARGQPEPRTPAPLHRLGADPPARLRPPSPQRGATAWKVRMTTSTYSHARRVGLRADALAAARVLTVGLLQDPTCHRRPGRRRHR